MRVAVPVFPGSNCDHDALRACTRLDWEGIPVWHRESHLPENTQMVFLPGGFSYGDYLRCGALAAASPIMGDIRRFADLGGWVLGVCNGFQILCEAHMLPGALLRNASMRFIHRQAHIRLEPNRSPLLSALEPGSVFQMPIAHAEGNYTLPENDLRALEARKGIVFRYSDPAGGLAGANPNGSAANIAGIVNERGNVLGMMPHPERAMEALQGAADGLKIFQSMASTRAREPK